MEPMAAAVFHKDIRAAKPHSKWVCCGELCETRSPNPETLRVRDPEGRDHAALLRKNIQLGSLLLNNALYLKATRPASP
jgi:hypothetical protein